MSTERDTIEAQIASGEEALDVARKHFGAAAKRFQTLDEQYIDSGSSKDRTARRDAEDEMQRCEAISRRAQSKLDELKAKLAEAIRSEKVAEYEALKAKLGTFGKTLQGHVESFVAVDRDIDRRVLALAQDIRAVASEYDRAAALADELRLTSNFREVARPDLAEACRSNQLELAKVRAAEHRDDLASTWLRSASLDWRTRDKSAAELTAAETHIASERLRAIERDRAAMQGAMAALTAIPRAETGDDEPPAKETIQ